MMYNPIFLTALTMSEKVSLSGEMILRGMGTVFLVLALLWGIIAVFGMIFSAGKAPQKKESTPAKKESAPAPKKSEPAKPAQTPAAAPVPAPQSDDAVIAAICAAIEAYRAEEGLCGLPYRVVSFRRKSGRKSWTGTNED